MGSPCLLAALLTLACTQGEGRGAPRHDAGGRDGAPLDVAAIPEREHLPPPITGGTLLVTRDGRWAVAADPDTDRVSIVGIDDNAPGCAACGTSPRLLASIELPRGEDPGRGAEDSNGRVHVVLRKGGAVAVIDLASGALLARRPVCPEPRGIAFDDGAGLLHVACASGELVSLSPATGIVERRLSIDVDLRDVVVVPGGLVVSRFKTGELIRIDAGGGVTGRTSPTAIERGPLDLSKPTNDPLAPAVAWRAVSASTGSVFLLHQYGLARPIDLGQAGATLPKAPYSAGAGTSCGGIVEQTVSWLAPDGPLDIGIDMGMPLPVRALSVDVAVSADGQWVAVAHPGARADNVTIYRSSDLQTLGRSPVRCAEPTGRVAVEGQPVALALAPGPTPDSALLLARLVVQTRSPGALHFHAGTSTQATTVLLEGDAGETAGHDLFHLDGGGGIACAQCHPEGAEDGRVWSFTNVGQRRTQALHVGLEGSEPFHWSGDLDTFEALVDETLIRRMGGRSPSYSEVQALKRWVFALRPPTPRIGALSPAAARGRALFESTEVGCARCHDGAEVTKNTSEDVGTRSPEGFQIPALRGVAYRAPFLHDGRAATLRGRFTPVGGGDAHGVTSGLGPAEVDDLIAYLESL